MCHLNSIIVSLVRYEKSVKDTALKFGLPLNIIRGRTVRIRIGKQIYC